MNEINKGFFEEIKELDEEQNYSSGFNSHRSGDKGINESKYSQMKGSIIDEEEGEEDVFSDEDDAQEQGEKPDFVNLETPLGVGKSRGIVEEDLGVHAQIDLESSGDEVGVFEFKASKEEPPKKLIVSEAFGDDDEGEGLLEEEENIEVQPEEEDDQTLEDPEEQKPGDEANPNTPLIDKGIFFN